MGTPSVQRLDSFQQVFANLVADKIDMFASHLTPTLYHLKRLGFFHQVEPHPYCRPVISYYFALSDKPGYDELTQEFGKELKEYLDSSEYAVLLNELGERGE